MALTGLQVFKLLPNTNCKKCGYPTCLAFAMKLAAGKESLDKCPDASAEARAALGAASAPPIRGLTFGAPPRALIVGEETVFFRHEKGFARRPALLRHLDAGGPGGRLSAGELGALLDDWAGLRLERAGESFGVDGITVDEAAGHPACATALAAACARSLPVALFARTPAGAEALLAPPAIRTRRPLLVPPPASPLLSLPLPSLAPPLVPGQAADAGNAPLAAYFPVAARLGVPLVVSGSDLETLAAAATAATQAGVVDLLLEPPGASPAELHRNLSLIRRGALDRVHPGLGYPVFLRVGAGELEKAVLGICKFASVLSLADHGGEAWLPLWTLRQNIYTDPQKPLQMEPGVYPIGEPGPSSPLLVTTNFSLTYFIVSTELDGSGLPCHLAVVDSDGMSVLTAWSAGKFSGERVAKALREMGATERVTHKTVIIPGYAAVISGELEDSLGAPWRVLTGPQEAADIAAFFRDVWASVSPPDAPPSPAPPAAPPAAD